MARQGEPGPRDAGSPKGPVAGRPSTALRPMRHASLDRCLYCLRDVPGRTEEHLVPRALGGRWTLRDAVCEDCRRITGRYEQATLDREFAVPKTLLALKRRRARGKGPSRLPLVLLEGNDVASPLTADTFPRVFWLPAFEPAERLADGPSEPARLRFVACTLNLGAPSRRSVAATPTMVDPTAYACSLAKWAYALAVAERGLQCCDTQAIRDLLLGRRQDVFAFVGSSPEGGASAGWLHDYELRERAGWLTVRLALFASAGMAACEIVIGRI